MIEAQENHRGQDIDIHRFESRAKRRGRRGGEKPFPCVPNQPEADEDQSSKNRPGIYNPEERSQEAGHRCRRDPYEGNSASLV